MSEFERNLAVATQWSPAFKLVGDTTRLKLLVAIHFAGPGATTVTELARVTGVKLATASAALRAMESSGAMSSTREGRQIYYAIADGEIHRLLHWIGFGHNAES